MGNGTHIESTFTDMLACADYVLLTANSTQDMLTQLGLINYLNNRDWLQIIPQKTSVSIFGITQS